MGLKLQEDWGSTPAAINNCLTVAEIFDIQVSKLFTSVVEECNGILSLTCFIILVRLTSIQTL